MADKALMVREDMTLSEMGSVFVKSGFFQDTREAAQAIVKILAGRELGFGPIAAMTGVYIVKGRVSLSANLMAAAVKRHAGGKYNYRVMELTDKVCEIAFFEKGVEVGRSRFTYEDARKAGTQNMDKYPRNMLFARAMSNGVKWHCADVFAGPVYTPEEMGATVDDDGDVVEMPAVAPEPKNGNGNGHGKANELLFNDPNEKPAPVVAEPVAPEPEPETFKLAAMKIRQKANAEAWTAGCKAIAAKHPHYQTEVKGQRTGFPNYMHILGAAAKCGFATVDDANFESVLEQVNQRAAEKVAE